LEASCIVASVASPASVDFVGKLGTHPGATHMLANRRTAAEEPLT
jgi:hypothetical protein